GGALTQISPQSAAIKLPPYQLTPSSSNIHLLSAVAYDNQGNASNRDTVQVTVIPSTATITSGKMTVTTDGALADGSATNAVQALVTDVNNNPVSDQAVTFSADNGATVTPVIGTTGADGIATATLTNTTAGVSNVTASINGNSQYVNVTFIADGNNLSTTNSTLVANPVSIAADGTTGSLVTLMLLDINNNPVSGQTVTFASSLPNSSVGAVTDNGDGTYTASLTGTANGTASITALVDGNPFGVAPASVTLNAFTNISVNGANFATNVGFPRTGFTGAVFTLNVTGSPTDYNWTSSDTSWVAVDGNGQVSFINKGNSSPVTITATPTAGGITLTYTFRINSWFTNNGNNLMDPPSASSFCSTPGVSQPNRLQLTNVLTGGGTRQGGNDGLWSEWGDMGNYSGSGFVSRNYLTSEPNGTGFHFGVRLSLGSVFSNDDSVEAFVVCREGL
ncbi:MAG: Ig-like domain-containing protein, partial [Yersinia sp. (in: enterobacteria)]